MRVIVSGLMGSTRSIPASSPSVRGSAAAQPVPSAPEPSASEAFGKPLSELSPEVQRQILADALDGPIDSIDPVSSKP
jgi:hypothetical protein